MNQQQRDQEEIRRSALDAAMRKEPLLAKPAQLARYRNPPHDTVHHLEYAFHLLGDIQGKTVLDFGCGAGEHSLLLAAKGARVIGIDISPELIEIARLRLKLNRLATDFRIASAYATGLLSASVDIVFCISILHHLDLEQARPEVLRVLKPGGILIVQEPVRDSRTYAFLRGLIPYSAQVNSEHERPLRKEEIDAFSGGLRCEGQRRFRLPFVPLAKLASPKLQNAALRIDRWMLDRLPFLSRLATIEVRRLCHTCAPLAPIRHRVARMAPRRERVEAVL